MSRRDCHRWLEERQYPIPPKSACTFCPYHSNAMWREMRDNDPDSFADAVQVDAALRGPARHYGLKGELFVHRSARPLAVADLGGAEPTIPFGFVEECAGMCGN